MGFEAHILHAQDNVANLLGLEGGKDDLAARHIVRNLFLVKLFLGAVDDVFAIAHDAQRFGDGEHFVEFVADENQRYALFLQPRDDLVKRLHLFGRQRAGRLVHDDQFRVQQQRAADCHHLLFAHRQCAHFAVQVQRNADFLDNLRGHFAVALGVHGLVFVEQVVRHGDIFRNCKVGEQREILIDNLHARGDRLRRRQRFVGFPLDDNFTFVRRIDAGNDLDQRRLSAAVLTREALDFARTQLQIHMVQRLHGLKGLADVFYFQKVLTHIVPSRCTLFHRACVSS